MSEVNVLDIQAPPQQKPGWKTTEFWLTTVASVLTAYFTSGLPLENVWGKAMGVLALCLGAAGYSVGRAMVKSR